MEDFKLSPNFRFFELTDSASRPDLVADNREQALKVKGSLELLCASILEPMREKFGPLVVHSGFRSQALNRAVGGSPTSQHELGEAADITTETGAGFKDMADWLFSQQIAFGQAIIEGACLHVSLPGSHSRQIGSGQVVAGKWVVTPFPQA
jgi:hypothetical protein